MRTTPAPGGETAHRVLHETMADEIKADETAIEDATQEKKEVQEEVDYDKELIEAQKEAEARRLGYAMRHAKKEVEAELEPEQDQSDLIAEKVINKVLPVINSATQSNLIEGKLDELSEGNDALKKLIRFHMDNSVNPTLDLNSRLDAAYAIANKKVIAKTVKEINLAQKNRSQIVNTGEGASIEPKQTPGANVLSENQKAEIRRQAESIGRQAQWGEKEKARFIAEAEKRLASPK